MKKVLKKVWSILSTILIAVIIACTVFLVVVKFVGETPSVFGYNFYYIITGSMEPTLAVGDIILSKETSVDKLEVGDVVTFEGESGELDGKIVTHRIQSIYDEDGQTFVVTKGDANAINDPPIRAEAVLSVMKCKVPLLGKLIGIINTPIGFLLLIVSPLLISLIKEIIELIQAFRSTKEEHVNDEMDE